jgi:hypothetical protein
VRSHLTVGAADFIVFTVGAADLVVHAASGSLGTRAAANRC